MNTTPKSIEPDVEFKKVNRRAAIVRANQPFFEWALTACEGAPKFTLEDLRRQPTIWLLPIDENPKKFIRREFYVIFLHELSELCGNTNRWPHKRTFDKFRDWFEVEIVHSAYDLGNATLKAWR